MSYNDDPSMHDVPREDIKIERYPHMTVDSVTGAIYVYVREGKVFLTETFDSGPNLQADYSESGELIGVEILP